MVLEGGKPSAPTATAGWAASVEKREGGGGNRKTGAACNRDSFRFYTGSSFLSSKIQKSSRGNPRRQSQVRRESLKTTCPSCGCRCFSYLLASPFFPGIHSQPGLWGMTTSVIQQKGLPNDYFVLIKGDSLVSQKSGKRPE